MKRLVSMLIFMLALPVFGQNFRTGDATLETELRNINVTARKDLRVFKSQTSTNFGVAVPKLDKMLAIMQPAEVILSLRIARVRNISVDRVIQSYKVNKGKGWGVIAKDLGIKPGSTEFHALKRSGKKATPPKKPASQGKPNGQSQGPNSQEKGKSNGNSNGKGKH